MAIKIERCKIEDAVNMILCGEAAFANDVLINGMFDRRTATPEQIEQYRDWRVTVSKKRMAGAGKHYFKAVDETNGKLVGYMGMFSPGIDIAAQSDAPRPAFADTKVGNDLTEKLDAAREKWIGDRKDVWFVQSMCVHPDYQGRGIGKRLLQRGLQEVDKMGQDTFLEASPAGSGLYESCGFQIVEEVSLLDGQYRLGLMLRHPQSVSVAEKN